MTTEKPSAAHPFLQSAPIVIGAGCLIAVLGFGPRSTMGFFLTPITNEYGWGREVFALAIAIQNLVWGIGQPFVGMLADRFGTARVLTGGALLYALGLALMARTSDPVTLQLTAGVLVGLGIAGSAFLLVMAAFARLLPREHAHRSASASAPRPARSASSSSRRSARASSSAYGWQTALIIMAAILMVVPILAYVVRGKPKAAPVALGQIDQSIIRRAARGLRPRLLPAAGRGLLRLRLPDRVHHRPPAALSVRHRHPGDLWRLSRIGAHRPVQHHRLDQPRACCPAGCRGAGILVVALSRPLGASSPSSSCCRRASRRR